jgi:hypothetical protein
MITKDASTWVALLEGGAGEHARLLDRALEDRHVVMVPVVLTELVSDPNLPSGVTDTLSNAPPMESGTGYWRRAGALRGRHLQSVARHASATPFFCLPD